jgi:2-oxoglutarate dehydrogenase E2 component (dihydrolipoamide succinyltransferase)
MWAHSEDLMGTPIINHAIKKKGWLILAVGAIKKRPVVVETPDGDSIGHPSSMMSVRLSYDPFGS